MIELQQREQLESLHLGAWSKNYQNEWQDILVLKIRAVNQVQSQAVAPRENKVK